MSIIDGISNVNIIFKMGHYRGISIAILLLVSVFLISACDSLVTAYPVSITSEKKDMSDLQGTWGSDSVEPFSIVFDSNGIAHKASLAWNDEKQAFDIEESQFVTTWWGNNKYLSFLKLNNVELGTYPLAQYNIQDDLFILCTADADIFKQAIEDKELSGFIKVNGALSSTTTIITSDRDVLRQYLINNEDKQLFECNKESAIRRIFADRPNDIPVFEITEKDEKETMEVLQERARQGEPDAQWELYREYPTEENLIWLCQAADFGQTGARYELGKLYFFGSGRYRNFGEARIPSDLSMACMWSHLAGQAQIIGEPEKEDIGLTSVAYDSTEVERTAKVMTTQELEEAAKLINDWKPGQCDRDFALYLGAAYTQDSSLAGLCIAADHQNMSARESLGRLFFFGSKGVDADLPRAYMWYHLAAQVYVPPGMAGGSMQFQCDSMTPEQRSVAVKLLEEWEPGKCEETLLQ